MTVFTFFPLSTARGRLEANHDGTSVLLSGPVAPDPVLYPGCYSARTPAHRPRISPNATHILERGQRGVVGELLKLDSVSFTPVPKQSKCNRFCMSVCLKRVALFCLEGWYRCVFLFLDFTYKT